MRVRKKKWASTAINEITQCLTREKAQHYKGKWRYRFTEEKIIDKPVDLYVEIGCGKGKFITELAKKNPSAQLVALDNEINALCFAARKVEVDKLPISLIYGTAENLTELFAEGEVTRIYLNFSTPWPKKAHHKRRLTYPLFLSAYEQVLAINGEIILKTDNSDFFQASQAYLRYMGFKLILVNDDISLADDVTGITTEYENRFRDQGLAIHQLVAVKPAPDLQLALKTKWQAKDSELRANTDWQADFAHYTKLAERNNK